MQHTFVLLSQINDFKPKKILLMKWISSITTDVFMELIKNKIILFR